MTGADKDRVCRASTEARNQATVEIDTLPCLDVLRLINDEDKKVALAVEKALPDIARAVDRIADGFRRGGRLIYAGAGTSGRLGVLDASECPPTYGVQEDMVVALIAGGPDAISHSVEGAEDDAAQGAADVDALILQPADVVVGIAASGRTPYVAGALQRARAAGATTVALACNAGSHIGSLADIAIEPTVGPEVVTGSTRMKAGTAQKMVLNMLSTGAMIRIGKVHGNLMVDMVPANEKLRARAAAMVSELAGRSLQAAELALENAGGSIKLAVVMLVLELDADSAQERLDAAGGILREALSGNLLS